MFLKVTVSISCFWRYVPFYMVFTRKCVFQCVQHMKYINLNFNMSMCFVCHHEVTWPNCLGLFGDVHQFMFGIWVCVYIYNTYIYILKLHIYIYIYVYQWYCLVFFGIVWIPMAWHEWPYQIYHALMAHMSFLKLPIEHLAVINFECVWIIYVPFGKPRSLLTIAHL